VAFLEFLPPIACHKVCPLRACHFLKTNPKHHDSRYNDKRAGYFPFLKSNEKDPIVFVFLFIGFEGIPNRIATVNDKIN
jgi:hypothetical protein